MILKGLIDEDFVNYKKPSMVLFFPNCTFKCEKECGERVCQNGTLANSPSITVSNTDICTRYISNTISKAITCGGLEPMDSFEDLMELIGLLRNDYKCSDDIVIYTGYTESECHHNKWIERLSPFKNIVFKFGRFVPYQKPHFDSVLGINLISDNQYGKRF